jgi:UDP-N-acetylmuramoyl-tripeptide--D-alanyl-D-alanine ligase
MLELGRDEIAFHKEIGEVLDKAGVEALFAFGKLAKYYLDKFRAGKKVHFDDKHELSFALKEYARSNDVILVKGSRGMALEEITDFMMNDL